MNLADARQPSGAGSFVFTDRPRTVRSPWAARGPSLVPGKRPRRRHSRPNIELSRRPAHTGMPARGAIRDAAPRRGSRQWQTSPRPLAGRSARCARGLVRQSREHRHDGALSRALPELRHQPEELRSGRPIIGIAQTGSDLGPCNRHHLVLAERVRDGIAKPAGSRSSFRSTRSRRPASGRPRRSTATSPTSAWSRCSTAIRSTGWC